VSGKKRKGKRRKEKQRKKKKRKEKRVRPSGCGRRRRWSGGGRGLAWSPGKISAPPFRGCTEREGGSVWVIERERERKRECVS